MIVPEKKTKVRVMKPIAQPQVRATLADDSLKLHHVEASFTGRQLVWLVSIPVQTPDVTPETFQHYEKFTHEYARQQLEMFGSSPEFVGNLVQNQ